MEDSTSPEDEGDISVPEAFEIKAEVEKLTATEREIINEVLRRDEEVTGQEKNRLKELKHELDELAEKGIPEGKENLYGRACARCCGPLGLVVNRGSLCAWCRKKICRNCRKPISRSSWICTMCYKEREIKAESGAWFYDSLPKKKRVQYGSTLLKKFVRRRKSMKSKNLSKSRRISEDDLVTSGEIEYTVERTFKPRSLDPKDHEYIVVDQAADGDISIVEGIVASNISYESEAAALDIVHERDENEAASRDAAMNDAVFSDADITGSGDGMLEYLEQNTARIEPALDHAIQSDVMVNDDYDRAKVENEDTEMTGDKDSRADSRPEAQMNVRYNLEEAEKSNDLDIEVSAGPYEDSGTPNESDSAIKDESLTENTAISVEGIELNSVSSKVAFFMQKSDSIEEKQIEIEKSTSDNYDMQVTEKEAELNEEAGLQKEAESEMTTEEKPNEPMVLSAGLTQVQQPEKKRIAASCNPFDDDSDVEAEQIKDSLVSQQKYEEKAEMSDLRSSEIGVKFEEYGLSNSKRYQIRDDIEKIPDVELTKQLETEVAVEQALLEKEAGITESNESKVSDYEMTKNEETEILYDAELKSELEIESTVLEMKISKGRQNYEETFMTFDGKDDSARLTALKTEENAGAELLDQTETEGSVFQKAETVGLQISNTREDQTPETGTADHDIETTSVHEAADDRDKEPTSESNVADDHGKVDYSFDEDMQPPAVKNMIAFYAEKEQTGEGVSLKLNAADESLVKNVTVNVSSEKEVESSEKEVETSEEDIKRFEKEAKRFQEEEFISEKEVKSSEKELKGSDEKMKNSEKEEEIPEKVCPQETNQEVSYNQETGKVNGYAKAPEEFENTEDIDAIFEEYIQKEKAGQPSITTTESYESLDSNRSDDVYEALRPQVKVAGEILLGFKYELLSQHFEIQVHKAKGLVAVDTRKNTSDPYVKTYLRQDKIRSNKKKTKVKKHTLEPVFDEILTYKIGYEDLLEKVLDVSVWHNDTLGQNVFLGEAHISIADYIASGYSLEDPVPQMYQLSERQRSKSLLKPVGELSLEIMYIPPGAPPQKYQRSADPVSGQLVVKCIEGKDLEGSENTSPFCKLVILPVKNKSKDPKHKTTVESRTLNPYWDQEFVFENITFSDLSSKVLQVSVHDASAGSKKNFLGAVRLGLGTSEQAFDDSNDKECVTWQKMLQEPNKRISATLSLRSTIESLKSSASLPPVLVERIDEVREEVPVREKKSDSVLSSISISSFNDSSSLKGASLKPKFKAQPDQYSLQSYGSLMSVYSDAGGYGSVPISGEMLFSIQYDNIAGVFEVHISKAKNIAAANKKTRNSDPYVKTYLLPDKSKDSKKKTSFKKKTINPEWNETIKYKIGQKDLMKRTLQVSIWNNEKFGHNDFLGEVQVQIAQYVSNGHSLDNHEPIWYTLQEMAPISVSGPGYKGALTIGLKFEVIEGELGKLLVEVKEAKDLAAADLKSLSNPFVKSYLLPDRTRKSKRKSTFKKGTLNPKWNEKFEYNGVTLAELEHRVLELTVWDHEPHSNDFLGGTRVGLGRGDQHWHDCIGKETSVWNAMLEHPGIWVEYSIPLRDSMTSRKGMDLSPPDVDASSKPVEIQAVEPLDAQQGEGIKASDPLLRVGLMFVAQESGDDRKKKKGQLKVNLRGARNLPLHSEGVSPTTYCKCFLQPRKSIWKFKTDLFKRSSEPFWEKECVFSGLSLEELSSKCLDVVIFHDNDVSIGMARLGMGIMQAPWDDSTGREIEIWKAMIENPGEWNNLMIPLRLNNDIPSGDLSDAEDQVEVAVEEKLAVLDDKNSDSKASLTAKELALQSMGQEAVKVVDIIKNSGGEITEQKKTSNMKSFSRSQDHLDRNFRPLSLVREEAEEPGTEEPSHVRFSTDEKTVSENRSSHTVGNAPAPYTTIPKITLSTNEDSLPNNKAYVEEEIEFEEDEIPHKISNTNLSRVSKFGSRESLTSMTSVYSGIAPIYGTVPIKGSIQFAMKYSAGSSIFEVHIFKAKDIAAVDARKDVSDPYVKVYLLPDKTKGSKRKTKVKHKTINPVWDEIIDYKMSLPELRKRILLISIWNYDRFGRNIFLGEVVIPMEEEIVGNSVKQVQAEWYDLQEKSQIQSPTLYKGELTIGLMFEDLSGTRNKTEKKSKEGKSKKKIKDRQSRICVHVIRAEDLPAGDADGMCDPYCKFYLLPLKQSKTKRKTPVIKKARSAYWDFKAEYDADYDDLPELGIEFTVYDWDKHSRNDFLGCARLNLGGQNGKWDDAVGVEKEAWQTMIQEPNTWHQFVIPLRSSSDPRPKMDYD